MPSASTMDEETEDSTAESLDREQEKDDGVAIGNKRDPLLDSQGEDASPAGVEPETEMTSAEEDEDGKDVDRWGWMVTFGISFNYIFISGYNKSNGLIFVELLHKFNASDTETTLLFAIKAAVQSIVGFYLLNVLLERVQARTLVLLGGTLIALSAITSSFANHLILFICLQSFLLAIGSCMLIAPGHVLLGRYFHRRLAVALCLSECGVSVGGLLVPPLVSHLLHEYALPGALLIYGGICLNTLPAGLLHRPVSNIPHPKSSGVRAAAKVSDLKSMSNPLDPNSPSTSHCARRASSSSGPRSASVLSVDDIDIDIVTESLPTVPMLTSCHCENTEEKDISLGVEEFRNGISRNSPALKHKTNHIFNTKDASLRNLKGNEFSTARPKLGWQESVARISLSMSSVYSSNAQLNKSRNELKSLNPEWTHGGQRRKSVTLLLERSRTFFSILDFSLFRSPLFCLLLCMCVTCYVVDFVLDYLPALVDENGLTESQAALLLSIIGGLGLVCRLACVFLQKLRLVRATTLALVANLILGVTLQFVGFMTSFEQYLVLAVVDGLLGSVANCLFPLLVIEFVGVDNMAKCFSILQLFGVLNSALYLLMGYIRDVSGSYVYVFHVIGGLLITSALLLACERPVRRLENRRELAKTKDASVKRFAETTHEG